MKPALYVALWIVIAVYFSLYDGARWYASTMLVLCGFNLCISCRELFAFLMGISIDE